MLSPIYLYLPGCYDETVSRLRIGETAGKQPRMPDWRVLAFGGMEIGAGLQSSPSSLEPKCCGTHAATSSPTTATIPSPSSITSGQSSITSTVRYTALAADRFKPLEGLSMATEPNGDQAALWKLIWIAGQLHHRASFHAQVSEVQRTHQQPNTNFVPGARCSSARR
jgi:hypothetical protein